MLRSIVWLIHFLRFYAYFATDLLIDGQMQFQSIDASVEVKQLLIRADRFLESRIK